MRKILYIVIIGLLFSSISCSDFLEPKSTTEFTPEDVSSLNELILGTACPSASNSNSAYWGLLNYFDDDITNRPYVDVITNDGTSVYNDHGIQAAKILYSWTEDYDLELRKLIGTGENYNTYPLVYKFIIGANAVLDYIDDMVGTENEKRNVKAQAYALRAFHYFHLTNIFGTPYQSHPNGLGVPLKLTSKIEETSMTRNTVAECYDQILADLLAAEDLYLAMGDAHKWKPDYRPSLAMVRLMLSRVYLYMEQWERSAYYAKLVMSDSNFSLHDLNNTNLFPVPERAKSGTEYTNFIGYYNGKGTLPETIWVYGNVTGGQAMKNIAMHPTSTAQSNKAALFNASTELLDSYKEKVVDDASEDDPDLAASDLRRLHYIVAERNAYNTLRLKRAYGKVSMSSYSSGRWPVTIDIVTGRNSFGRALRLSEAYLNYAEAMAMMAKEGIGSGADSEAIAAINTLREKRIKTSKFTALSPADFQNPTDLVNFVRNERRRELCFEGHRWFDLRRYGMPAIKHVWRGTAEGETIDLEKNGRFYAVPIPQSVLDQNSSLDAESWK